jgi:hypothetical protein
MDKGIDRTGLRVQTQLHSGNKKSDFCYSLRTGLVFMCAIRGWPTDEPTCAGDTLDKDLKYCLSQSKEPNWWVDFYGCTDAEQCKTYRPPCRQKCYDEHEARKITGADPEWTRCVRTCSE